MRQVKSKNDLARLALEKGGSVHDDGMVFNSGNVQSLGRRQSAPIATAEKPKEKTPEDGVTKQELLELLARRDAEIRDGFEQIKALIASAFKPTPKPTGQFKFDVKRGPDGSITSITATTGDDNGKVGK